jgi:hypothetical protein
MALQTSQLTATTNKLIDKKVVDGVFKSNGAYALLSQPGKMKMRDGGVKLSFPISTASEDDTTGGWYAGSAGLDGSEYDPITDSQHDWKFIYEHVTIPWDMLLKASGPANQVGLLASRVDIAFKAMAHRMGTGLHNDGTTADAFIGLDAIMSTSSTYGGIAVADFAEWIAAILQGDTPGTNQALTLARIQQAMGSATEGQDKPDFAILRQNVFNELWELLQPHQRLSHDENLSGLGHSGVLKFNGIPWIVDSKHKANAISFLNSDYFFLVAHPKKNMKRESFNTLESADAFRTRITFGGALVCSNRRFQGRLEDITAS